MTTIVSHLLHCMVEDFSYALDQTVVILLDFAKAFDSAPHQKLLAKLR